MEESQEERNELQQKDYIYAGHLTGLPQKESSVVRIFLSSTFTDMQSERNWLMKNAVPRLRQFCRERGLDFQIADMRWGVREDASDDHKTTELCLREIANCQNISLGPNFVAFLGDKYGYRPLPAKIEGSLFKLIKNTAKKLGYDVSVILTWYKCDNNHEPSTYVLQPISSHFPYYIDYTAANAVLRQQAQRDWTALMDKLNFLFRECVDILYKERRISQEERHLFYQSVTESEVVDGILKVKNLANTVICFERTLIDLDVTERIAARYTDLDEEGADKEVEELREHLRLVKVPAVLPSSQLFRYNVPWKVGGMDITENPDHLRYVELFGQDFTTSLEKMIEEAYIKSQAVKGRSPLLEEVLHHLYFCQTRIETFCGRSNLLKDIYKKLWITYGKNKSSLETKKEEVVVNKSVTNGTENGDKDSNETENYVDTEEEEHADIYDQQREKSKMINDEHMSLAEQLRTLGCEFVPGDSMDDIESDPTVNFQDRVTIIPSIVEHTKPIIVYGESGCGKTALMAKVAELSKQWIPESFCIVRFLGTSTMSTTIREVLYNLCQQIWHLYKVPKPTGIDIDVDFQFLLKYFHALLWQINTTDHPLVIILDSVDQLSPADHAHFFNWIPHKLPLTVHLMISMVTNRHDCLMNIREIFVENNQYIEVVKLEKETAEAMIGTLCRRRNRHLSKKQQNMLLSKFDSCSQPLYLKLLTDMALSWKSYTKVNAAALGVTVKEAINHLFDNLEKNHGVVLIQKAFGYLCAACEGLTVTEVEDLLSLDDEVLQDTYIYHLPPDPDIIRLPPLLWKRVQNEIEEYLVERQSGDKKVVTWYHRQFMEAAQERYLPEDKKIPIHKALAEYFQGVWSSTFKPLELKKGKKGYYPKAMRNVPAQPFKFSDTLYNTRKFSELPYHMINSRQFKPLLVDLLLDPHWLYGKCHVASLTALMQDIQSAESSCAEVVAQDKKRLSESKNSRKKDSNPVRKHQMDAQVLECIKQLARMILLASDSIRKDPVYLPVQILCQLGPDYHSDTFMDEFVSRCKIWCQRNATPLLLPLRQCMLPPGGHLMYTIEVELAISDRDEHFEGLSLRDDINQLYVIKNQSAKPDQILVLDIQDYGSCIQTVDFPCFISSVKFKGKNKFLLLTTHVQGSSEVKLYRSSLASPVALPKPVQVIAISNSGAYVAYASGSVVVVCVVAEGELQPYFSMEDHKSKVTTIKISPKDSYLVTFDRGGKETYFSSRDDTTIFVFDLKLKQLLYKITAALDLNAQTQITKQGLLISNMGGYKNQSTLAIYDIKREEMASQIKFGIYCPDFIILHSSHLYVLVAFSGTGITNGNKEKHAWFVRLHNGQKLGQNPVNGPYNAVTVFGSDRLYYATSNWNKSEVNILFAGTTLQPLSRARLVHTLGGHNQPVVQILVTSTLDVMYTASKDNTIKVWDMKPILEEFSAELSKQEMMSEPDASLEDIVASLPQKKTEIKHTTTRVALNRLGDCVYVGTDTSQLRVYDSTNGQLKLTSDLDIGPVRKMMLSRNGQFLIVSGMKIHIEDLQSLTSRVLEPRGPVSCMAESNNILVAGVAAMEAKARVWNIETGEILKDFEMLYAFNCVAINSLGNVVLGTFFEFPVLVHLTNEDVYEESGMNTEKMDVMMTSAVSCCFSPDDKLAACSTVDGAVRVISDRGVYLYRFQQRSSAVALAFHPNGKTLISAGYRSIYVWNVRDGSLKYKLTRHRDFVNCLKFDETGRYLVTASRDKQLVLWDFRRCISIATFQTNCQTSSIDIAAKAEVITYIPDGIGDVAIIRPNESLGAILRGHYKAPPVTPQTQALALAFTGQTTSKTSRSCAVM